MSVIRCPLTACLTDGFRPCTSCMVRTISEIASKRVQVVWNSLTGSGAANPFGSQLWTDEQKHQQCPRMGAALSPADGSSPPPIGWTRSIKSGAHGNLSSFAIPLNVRCQIAVVVSSHLCMLGVPASGLGLRHRLVSSGHCWVSPNTRLQYSHTPPYSRSQCSISALRSRYPWPQSWQTRGALETGRSSKGTV